MILGRQTNLWNGLVVAFVSLVSIVTMQLVPDLDSKVVATIASALTLFLGTVIALVANQPPTVAPGTQVTVRTPDGEADRTATVH